MKKYLLMQLKRAGRFLPWALAVVLILFGCLVLAQQSLSAQGASEAAENNQKVRIGMVGTAQDQYLQWGMALMQLDSAAMSLELVPMDEAAARSALQAGEIAAYLVFPEGFVDAAMGGDVAQLQVVSTAGASGLVAIVKNEILTIVDRILVACENGSFGIGDATVTQGDPGNYGKYVDGLALEYVELLFDRSAMYRVETLPQNQVPLGRYMLGGLTVVLLMMSALPFAPLYIRREQALSRLLQSRGVPLAAQAVAEFTAFLAAMLIMLLTVAAMLHLTRLSPEGMSWPALFWRMLPAALMAAGFGFCVYCLSDHLISGVLLAFFGILALCFTGGCLYPVYVFPETLQRVAMYLPTGLACRSMIACFAGEAAIGVLPLLGYSGGFLGIGIAVRCGRSARAGG